MFLWLYDVREDIWAELNGLEAQMLSEFNYKQNFILGKPKHLEEIIWYSQLDWRAISSTQTMYGGLTISTYSKMFPVVDMWDAATYKYRAVSLSQRQ